MTILSEIARRGGEVMQMSREEQMRTIIEAVASADSEDVIGSIDVEIPNGSYPRQWLRNAAQELVAERLSTPKLRSAE